ncbi:MAG TPA: CRISPR-associated protein Cas4 [Anaerovoracaceae bacterium]|nr:CRISPR-associated protein Cas4 [Anaerovoracaceae bacterium]
MMVIRVTHSCELGLFGGHEGRARPIGKVTGIRIQYYVVCQRKLWLFDKGIRMEQESDRVLQGSVLHQRSYNYLNDKEIMVDNQFRIDVIDGEYIREVKLTSRMTEADRWQTLFYLWQLKIRGVHKKGLISYPKEKMTEELILTEKDEKKLADMVRGISRITSLDTPPPLKRLPYCTKCAYYSFCYVAGWDD